MKPFVGVAFLALALCFASLATAAPVVALGSIRIASPWVRPNPPGAPTAAGYAAISNVGHAPDRLIAASSPDAKTVELHQMLMAAGGVMRMRPVAGGLPIGPGQTVTLAPGGYHLMLTGPTHAFRVGELVPITLTFQHAGAVRVRFQVENAPAAPGGMPGMDMH
jgi:copper(I)-binding protein